MPNSLLVCKAKCTPLVVVSQMVSLSDDELKGTVSTKSAMLTDAPRAHVPVSYRPEPHTQQTKPFDFDLDLNPDL